MSQWSILLAKELMNLNLKCTTEKMCGHLTTIMNNVLTKIYWSKR